MRISDWSSDVCSSDLGRGEIGRRARFRFWYRKMWGFESLRPHQCARPWNCARRQRNSALRKRLREEMQTVETLNEGLKRAYTVTITSKDIDARVEKEVAAIAPQVRMPGLPPNRTSDVGGKTGS